MLFREKLLQKKIKDLKMAGARRTNIRRLVSKPERKCYLKYFRVNGMIILICILNKYCMRMGIGCISVDIATIGEVL
jgi:preprotein translocase subunit Sss1